MCEDGVERVSAVDRGVKSQRALHDRRHIRQEMRRAALAWRAERLRTDRTKGRGDARYERSGARAEGDSRRESAPGCENMQGLNV